MNQIIKERISQIQNGIVPEGYKKTVLGIVPEEWEETTLSELFTFKNGLNKEKEAFGKGTPIINYTDVWKKRGIRAATVEGKVELSEKEIENYNVQKGDVFFTRTSETRDEIGLSSVLLDDIDNAVFSGFVLRARPINDRVETRYHQYCYSSPLMRHEIIRKSSITTRALTSGASLGQVAINLPSKPEQKRIADILEKWDKVIELQEQYINMLIINKRSLINQLFKPRAKWLSKPMKDIFVVRSGYAFKSDTYVDDGRYYIITIANVKESEFVINKETATIDSVPSDIKDFQQLKRGDILMSLTGNVARVCKTEINHALLNQRVGKIEVKPGFDKEFVYYLLQTYKFVEYMKMFAQGAAQDNLSVKDVYRFRLTIPTEIDEQRKIRKVLQSIDTNISKQKQKLELLKQQQKSMQQLLLTGIVRV